MTKQNTKHEWCLRNQWHKIIVFSSELYINMKITTVCVISWHQRTLHDNVKTNIMGWIYEIYHAVNVRSMTAPKESFFVGCKEIIIWTLTDKSTALANLGHSLPLNNTLQRYYETAMVSLFWSTFHTSAFLEVWGEVAACPSGIFYRFLFMISLYAHLLFLISSLKPLCSLKPRLSKVNFVGSSESVQRNGEINKCYIFHQPNTYDLC